MASKPAILSHTSPYISTCTTNNTCLMSIFFYHLQKHSTTYHLILIPRFDLSPLLFPVTVCVAMLTVSVAALLAGSWRGQEILTMDGEQSFLNQKHIPSRELTYPTLGKGKSSSNMPYQGDMLVPWRVHFLKLTYHLQNPLVGRWVSFWEGLRAGARLVFGSAQLRKGVEIVPSTVLSHMLSVEWFTFKAYIYKLTYCHTADIQEMTHIKDFAGYFPWLLWFGIIPSYCTVDIMLIFFQ